MPLSSLTPWLAAGTCSTGCCLEGWTLAQFLSHHESLQCRLPFGLCAETNAWPCTPALCPQDLKELTLCSPLTLCSAAPVSAP